MQQTMQNPKGHRGAFHPGAPAGQNQSRATFPKSTDAPAAGIEPAPLADHASTETEEISELLKARRVDRGRLGSIVHSLHSAVKTGPLEVMSMAYSNPAPGQYLADHSRNVAKLAMFLAEKKGYQVPSIRVAGIAGILHDIAMRDVPEDALAAAGPPDPNIAQKLWDHPFRSAEIVASSCHLGGLLRNVVPAVIRQHHERADGSGYPLGLKAKGTKELARILAIADSFEAMIAPRAYRRKWHPNRALSQLLLDTFKKQGAGLYDRTLVNIFLRAVSLYPVGSAVCLSNGQVARVVHSNPKHPKRPVVRPLVSGDGESLDPEIIDLAQTQDLRITKPWAEETPQPPGAAPATHQTRPREADAESAGAPKTADNTT